MKTLVTLTDEQLSLALVDAFSKHPLVKGRVVANISLEIDITNGRVTAQAVVFDTQVHAKAYIDGVETPEPVASEPAAGVH